MTANQLLIPRRKIYFVDNSMLKDFRACKRSFRNRYLYGLTEYFINPDLHAGGAFSKAHECARESYYGKGKTAEQAIFDAFRGYTEFWGEFQAPEKRRGKGYSKNFINVFDAFLDYYKRWPLGADHIVPLPYIDKPWEFTFTWPIPEVINPDTGEAFLYAGRFDLFGLYHRAFPCILDEKTSGSTLTEDWAKKFRMSGQLLGYSWVGKQLGYKPEFAIIRGTVIQMTQCDHLEVPIPITDYMLNRWHNQLVRDLDELAEYLKDQDKHWDYNFGDACTAFGSCEFLSLCESEIEDNWVGTYSRRNWNPLDPDPTMSREVQKAQAPKEEMTLEDFMEGVEVTR